MKVTLTLGDTAISAHHPDADSLPEALYLVTLALHGVGFSPESIGEYLSVDLLREESNSFGGS